MFLNKKKQMLALQLFFNVMLKELGNNSPLLLSKEEELKELQKIVNKWLKEKREKKEEDEKTFIFNIWLMELEHGKVINKKTKNKKQLEKEFNWLWLNYAPGYKK